MILPWGCNFQMGGLICNNITIKVELEIYYVSKNLVRLSLHSKVLIILGVTMIAKAGEEGVLGLAPASLELIAASIVGRDENSRENYFKQGQLLLKWS